MLQQAPLCLICVPFWLGGMAREDGTMKGNEGKELCFFLGSRDWALDAGLFMPDYGRERIVLKRGKLIRATNNSGMTGVLTLWVLSSLETPS